MPYHTDDTGLHFYYYGEEGAPAGQGKEEQNWKKIVKHALDSKKLFEDPNFPANSSVLGGLKLGSSNSGSASSSRSGSVSGSGSGSESDSESKARKSKGRERSSSPSDAPPPIRWFRPHEIAKQKFDAEPIFHGTFNEFAVDQGCLIGDCWFLAVLADVATKPECIKVIVPDDNDEHAFKTGAFHFRFWIKGKWTDIVVDDLLPCSVDKDDHSKIVEPVCTNPTKDGGFWAPLLEKAYAKSYGTYKQIDGGFGKEAMLDFTGGFCQSFEPKDSNLKDVLVDAASRDALISVGTKDKFPHHEMAPKDPGDTGPEDVTLTGIVCGHEYSVLDIQDVPDNSGNQVTLVKCRNPWGDSKEWNGDYSDKDPNNAWGNLTKDLRRKDVSKRADGEFWISLEDLIYYLEDVDVCHWSGIYRGNKSTTQPDGKFFYVANENFVLGSVGFGDGGNPIEGKPGYYVHLKPGPDAKGDVKHGLTYNCELSVLQEYLNYTKAGNDKKVKDSGFYYVWGPGHTTPEELLRQGPGKDAFGSAYAAKTRMSTLTKKFPEGTVVIIPALLGESDEGDEEEPYVLRMEGYGEAFAFSP